MSAVAPRTRLVVYTALVGPKEQLNNPLDGLPAGATSDLDLDFVCVTDNRALRSDVWRFVYLPTGHLPPEKLSRRPKALPHDYFADAEYSLYIDNTVTLRRLPQASDLVTEGPYLFRAFRHATRSTLQQEADAVAMLGYDDISTICAQLDFYASRVALDDITPLTTATVLLRSHHHETVRRFGTLWWESLLAFSKRDQLSIDFALQQAGAQIDYLPGATHDSELVHWHGSLDARRVRASFDARRYAWLHRHDPAAVRDPKAHFLTNSHGSDAPYQRRLPLLEYICHQQGSSLGAQVSPRRGMAEALDALLAPHRQGPCRYLLVRVLGDSGPQAFSGDELAAAVRAIGMLMGRAGKGTLLELSADDLAASDKVYTAQQQPYDLAIVIGLPGEQVAAATQKLMRLLAPAHGALVAALASPALLAEALRAEQLLGGWAGAAVHTALHGSRHDDVDGSLDNTVIGLRCMAAPVTAAAEPAELSA
jgi:hypothetical protein